MAQRDVVLRWIDELGRLVARLLGRRGEGDLLLAREQIERATADLLGPLALLVPRLDAAAAADIVGDPDRLFALAQLVELGGLVAEADGESGAAAAAGQRAVVFAEAAIARARTERPEWTQWVDARRSPS